MNGLERRSKQLSPPGMINKSLKELQLRREFSFLQSEMVGQMDSLRSPTSGLYHNWQDSGVNNSGYSLLPDNAYGMLGELTGLQTGKRTREDTISRLFHTLSSLENMQIYAGFIPTACETDTAELIRDDLKIAAVDNVHLFLANIAIGKILPELREETEKINSNMDFSFFLDKTKGLLHGVFDLNMNRFLDYHDGALASETRLAAYVYMIQTGDYDYYNRLLRNIPPEFTDKNLDLREVHSLKHKPLYQTNGGNLFEDVMPILFFPEELVSPDWRLQHVEMIRAEREYAKRYSNGLWGHIPADSPGIGSNEYKVFGIPVLAANSAQVSPDVISPYASLLVTQLSPGKVSRNLRRFKETYQGIHEHDKGFYDSVNISTGIISRRHLAINVGMGLVAVSNYLNDSFIRNSTSEFFEPILSTIATGSMVH